VIQNLSSRGNTRVKLAVSLKKTTLCRKQGKYLVEGPRYIGDMLLRNSPVEFLVLCEEGTDQAKQIAEQASHSGLDVLVLPEKIYSHVSSTEHSQGLSAVAPIPLYSSETIFNGGTVLALDCVSDPGNAGTAVRSAAAFGCSGVVFLAGSVFPWNPKVTRSSAGLNSSIPMIEVKQLANLTADYPHYSYLGAQADAEPLTIGDLSRPLCIVTGSEAHGLSQDTVSAINGTVSIPMMDGVESLNAGVSASILLYDLFRKKL